MMPKLKKKTRMRQNIYVIDAWKTMANFVPCTESKLKTSSYNGGKPHHATVLTNMRKRHSEVQYECYIFWFIGLILNHWSASSNTDAA